MDSNKAVVVDQRDPIAEEQLGLFKEYLSEPRFRIKLDDLVNANVRAALMEIGEAKFPLGARFTSGQDVAVRLKAYEDAIKPLQANAVLLGKWSTTDHRPTVMNLMARMTDNCVKPLNGDTICLSMRWYPLSLLAYSAGMAALSAENYVAFAAIHTKRINTRTRRAGDTAVPIIVAIVDAMLDLAEANIWKALPGHDRHHTPQSEYLFKTLQPVLDDLLLLGGSYDQLFDHYEILRTLMYADLTDGGRGPIGRFGWKHTSQMSDGSPYASLRTEADQNRDQWGPITAGLFRGSYERFNQVATKFESEIMSKPSHF